MRTTAIDYARFLVALMDEDECINEMFRSRIRITDNLARGSGWGLEYTRDGQYFWHWGDVGTFKSCTIGTKHSKKAIVILTNSANGLRVCELIVKSTLGGDHQAFKFSMIDY